MLSACLAALCCCAALLQRSNRLQMLSMLSSMHPCTWRLQITPAHDAKDFATGKRNNLEFINILNDDGTLNERCGPYAGRPRYEVRRRTIPVMPLPAVTYSCEGTSKFWSAAVGLTQQMPCWSWIAVEQLLLQTIDAGSVHPCTGAEDDRGVSGGQGPVPRHAPQPHGPGPLQPLRRRHRAADAAAVVGIAHCTNAVTARVVCTCQQCSQVAPCSWSSGVTHEGPVCAGGSAAKTWQQRRRQRARPTRRQPGRARASASARLQPGETGTGGRTHGSGLLLNEF